MSTLVVRGMAHPAVLSYSLRVSILVEIAEKADVSVEGVVRVLTREPVSEAIKERVLDVLDDLTPEQTRAVQRFALAALHDVLPRPGDRADADAEDVSVAPDQLELALPAAEPDRVPATGSETALVQLSSVLGELAEAVRDLRRETDAERRERVDDLAVLIDLITTGWQGLDARLGRIERQVGRLETGRREPASTPWRVAPVAVEAAPAETSLVEPLPAEPPPIELLPVEPVLVPPAEYGKRDRLPVVAALALVSAAIGTLAVLQLASGGPDLSRLVSARETPTTTTAGTSSTATAPTSTRAETRPAATTTSTRPPAATPSGPTTTSGVLGTTVGRSRPKPPPATAASGTSSPPPAATTTAATTRPATTAASPAGFRPTRNWAWAPTEGADYYDVEFSRAGASFYRASPTSARLTLPASVVFRPGSYRWVVRPGFGERAARNFGEPIVDSPFTVS